MDHFHLLFVTLLIFQESKNFPEEVLLFYIHNEYEEHERHSQKKLMSKVPRSEKIDINVTDTSIAYITIYKQKTYMVKTEVVFLTIVPIFFLNRIDLKLGLMILLSR